MGWLYLTTLVLGIGLWAAAAALAANTLVPSPQAVVVAAWQVLGDGSLWNNTLASLGRVVTGFLLGVALAIPAGFLMGWYWLARGLVEPWVQFRNQAGSEQPNTKVCLYVDASECFPSN